MELYTISFPFRS